MSQFENYKKTMEKNISTCLEKMQSLPIIFVGSGISKRYFNAPNWPELLKSVSKKCPMAKDFDYYVQTHHNDLIQIAEELVSPFKDWAWENRTEFDSDFFSSTYNSDIYLKSKVVDYLKSITPESISEVENYQKEFELLKKMTPHAIITTNYDDFIEKIFEDYTTIIGQKVLNMSYNSIGEIFKIHGCVNEPSSIVLTKNDYNSFKNKKKYLSAKLFTFFAEHPLIFIGYSASDPNIKSILSDIDELLSDSDGIVDNIYFVDWKSEINNNGYFNTTKDIPLDDGKVIKVNNIVASSYEWVFEAFSNKQEINQINTKVLRALLARVHTLVKTDIPNSTNQLNYTSLEKAVGQTDGIHNLLGFSINNTPTNDKYTYRLTDVAKELGYSYWYGAEKLLKIIKEKDGIDIKATDNIYHITVKVTGSSAYSKECIELLKLVQSGAEYTLDGFNK